MKSKASAFLTAVKDDLAVSATTSKSGIIDKMNLLLQAVNWNTRFSYFGSLTRPPCSTGVQYNILGTVLPIDATILTAIQKGNTVSASDSTKTGVTLDTSNKLTAGNNRAIQPMGGPQKGYANAVYIVNAADMLQLWAASSVLLVAAAI